MINNNHIEGGNKHLRQALTEEPAKTHYMSTKEALEFYKVDPNYTEVYIVSCNKCKHDMCIEVLEPRTVQMFLNTHHQGRRRITLGDEEYPGGRLLSHRKRLDGAMGYRCICGNNTIASAPELGNVPTVTNPAGIAAIPVIEPHHEAAVRLAIARTGYKPDVEELGDNKTRIESFTVERVK